MLVAFPLSCYMTVARSSRTSFHCLNNFFFPLLKSIALSPDLQHILISCQAHTCPAFSILLPVGCCFLLFLHWPLCSLRYVHHPVKCIWKALTLWCSPNRKTVINLYSQKQCTVCNLNISSFCRTALYLFFLTYHVTKYSKTRKIKQNKRNFTI